MPVPKLYRVFFNDNAPWFAEFYSDKLFEDHPVGVIDKKLVGGEVCKFTIVLAMNEDEALLKAKEALSLNNFI